MLDISRDAGGCELVEQTDQYSYSTQVQIIALDLSDLIMIRVLRLMVQTGWMLRNMRSYLQSY